MILILVAACFFQTSTANILCGQNRTLREGEMINFSVSTVQKSCRLRVFSATGKFEITPHLVRLPYSEECWTNGLAIQDKAVCGHFRKGQIGNRFKLETDFLDVEVYSRRKKSSVNITLQSVGNTLMARNGNFKENTHTFTNMLNKFTKITGRVTIKISPAKLNLNFDATITGTDQEHHGHPGSFGSTKEPSTTSQTTQTTKSPGIQNDEFDSPDFEDDYAVIPASGDKNPFNSRPHNGHKGRPGKLKEELEKVKKEVVELNETLSSEFQLYQQFQNELAKIEDELSALHVNDESLAQKLEDFGKDQSKDDLDMKTLLLISILSSRQGSSDSRAEQKKNPDELRIQ